MSASPSPWFEPLMPVEHVVLRAALRDRQRTFAPDWSRIDEDPGDALLSAFAHQLAIAATRANRLPGVVARRLVNLSGGGRLAPVPARAMVVVGAEVDAANPVPVALPARLALEARVAGIPDPVLFELEEPLDVFGCTLAQVVVERNRGGRVSAQLADAAALGAGDADLAPFGQIPAVSNAVWFGFAPPVDQGVLSLAFVAPWEANARPEVADPAGSAQLRWEILTGRGIQLVPVVGDMSRQLTRTGIVQLRLPNDWPSLEHPLIAGAQRLHWLRARIAGGAYARSPRLTGVYPNAGMVFASRAVVDQILEPVESPLNPGVRRFFLAERPVDPESVHLEVAATLRQDDPLADPDWQPWRRVEGLSAARPDEPVFAVDGETGEVTFGDGMRGREAPAGFRNLRVSYRVPGGAETKLPAGQRLEPVVGIPRLVSILTLTASTGGIDPRPGDDGDARSDQALAEVGGRSRRAGGRGVTAQDLEHLALRAPGASVDRAIVTPGQDLLGRPERRTAAVYLLRRPASGRGAPVADPASIDAVERYLRAAAPPGSRLQVGVPGFAAVRIDVTIDVPDEVDPGSAMVAVSNRLDRFLDPISGRGGKGWRPADALRHREFVEEVAAAQSGTGVPLVALVKELVIVVDGAGQPITARAGEPWPCADAVLPRGALPRAISHRIEVHVR